MKRRRDSSQSFSDRLKRALSQRIYLIGCESKKEDNYNFTMVGIQSNYTLSVVKGGNLSCSCYDCKISKHFCKHLINLLVKVMRVQPEIVNENQFKVMDEYLVLCAAYLKSKEPLLAREITEEDDCPICLESLLSSKEALSSCRTCRKSLHTDCFSKCVKFNSKCCYCRAEWIY